MKKIVVASANPIKINAALQGFSEMFPEEEFSVEGFGVPSGVSDQPMGDEETYQGAWNRVQAVKEQYPQADYWIGLEGGNIRRDDDMEVMAWIIVRSKEGGNIRRGDDMEVMAWIIVRSREGGFGKARTAGFYLPPKVVALINEGHELGHADDIIFGVSNSKQTSGSSGLLTNGVMDRLRFYVPAVVLALIPFLKPDLYPNRNK